MPNRRLTDDELQCANALLNEVRAKLITLAAGDQNLLFAYRRKVYKELSYDERGKPMLRRRLKSLKRSVQEGVCSICNGPLPKKYCVLDRIDAATGYTEQNTRLICPDCDATTQASRNYA